MFATQQTLTPLAEVINDLRELHADDSDILRADIVELLAQDSATFSAEQVEELRRVWRLTDPMWECCRR